ncbi:MAG: pectin acetylesterase-family hydrolase [Polyangiales bacterium]
MQTRLASFFTSAVIGALALGCAADDAAPSASSYTLDDDAPSLSEAPSVALQEPPSTAPTSGAPAPSNGKAFGEWTYHEVEGAVCRDGSPAGYYIRRGTGKDLMIFLNGGGVCYDDFFCGINPANVNSSLPGETLIAAVLDIGANALLPQRQVPPDAGIFRKDPRNPVADWNMVYVPYCTGDVYGGTKRDAAVPGTTLPPQQFVGYHNVGLFLEHFGPQFKGKAEQVLLTGSSAGGFGALLNFDRTQTYFGEASEVLTITDSGIPFEDDLLEPCLQKRWRSLWGLDGALPKDCAGCFNADGGGLARGLGDYIFRGKYKGRMLGGGVSTKQDEIIKLFFSSGLRNCSVKAADEAVPAALGLGSYPATRYPAGLKGFVENVAGRESVGSYIMDGTLHQHIFRNRYYEQNGLGLTMADWVRRILEGEPVHVGTF